MNTNALCFEQAIELENLAVLFSETIELLSAVIF